MIEGDEQINENHSIDDDGKFDFVFSVIQTRVKKHAFRFFSSKFWFQFQVFFFCFSKFIEFKFLKNEI